MWQKFLKTQNGSVGVMFAFLIMLLIIVVGVATDFSRQVSIDKKCQDLADNIALAAASALAEGKTQKQAREIAESVFAQNSIRIGSNITIDEQSIEIRKAKSKYDVVSKVNGNIQTSFLGIIGYQDLTFGANASSEVDLKAVEVAIVADISWSMKGEKLSSMKGGLSDFIDALIPNPSLGKTRKVSLIPYADTINFGTSYRSWLAPDEPPVAVPILQPDGTSRTEYRYLEPPNSQRFKGCFQHEPNSQIQTGRATYLRPRQYLSYIQSYQVGTPLCPSNRSQAVFFSGNGNSLKSNIRKLELGFGTSTDIGTLWGWRALSSNWRGKFKADRSFPKPFSEENIKHLIILTDGKSSRADMVGDGNSSGGVNREPATKNLTRLCEAIKRQNKIHVSTIAYGFTEKEKEMRPILENCVAKDGKFYEASTETVGIQLASLAQSMTKIRLTN
jgi:Flp pilus assembly protein TadG